MGNLHLLPGIIFAQLRALVESQDFSPTIRKEYSRLLPAVHHIQKKATGLKDKKLLLDDGSSQDFDYLVLASGSSFKSWPYLKSSETGLASRQKEVTITNSGPRILGGLSQKMTNRSEKLLKKMGVEILNNTLMSENSDGTWKDESEKIFSVLSRIQKPN